MFIVIFKETEEFTGFIVSNLSYLTYEEIREVCGDYLLGVFPTQKKAEGVALMLNESVKLIPQ